VRPHLVLDTGALLAYVKGSEHVGRHLADAADLASTAAIPAICLAEAYAEIHHDDHHYLDVLHTLPVVGVYDLMAGDCPIVGGLGSRTGRLGLGHAVFTALSNAALLLTSDPLDARRLLTADWPIEQV